MEQIFTMAFRVNFLNLRTTGGAGVTQSV